MALAHQKNPDFANARGSNGSQVMHRSLPAGLSVFHAVIVRPYPLQSTPRTQTRFRLIALDHVRLDDPRTKREDVRIVRLNNVCAALLRMNLSGADRDVA
jgi:hypothetical protein